VKGRGESSEHEHHAHQCHQRRGDFQDVDHFTSSKSCSPRRCCRRDTSFLRIW
jgi:hypothetical protein